MNSKPKDSSIWKPPGLVLAHSTMFTSFELDLFEKEILANPRATEHDASHFFLKFPKFLLLGVGSEIRREVLLFASNGQTIGRVDFFRRSHGKRFWDLIEIKSPQVPLIVRTGHLHPKLSGQVEAALDQVQDYKEIIETSQQIREELRAKGVPVCRPEMFVIAGQDNAQVPQEVVQKLFDRVRQKGIQLYTFTDLLTFAREHYLSNKVIIVPAFYMSPTVLPKQGAAPDAQHLLEVWLKGRLIHKINDVEREFRPQDPRSNRYHLDDFSRMVKDFEKGLQTLTVKKERQPEEPEARLTTRMIVLRDNLHRRLQEAWVIGVTRTDFLPNMKRITTESLREVLELSDSKDI